MYHVGSTLHMYQLLHPIISYPIYFYDTPFATSYQLTLSIINPQAIGVDTRAQTFTQANFYTAHECLLLPYEQALTREDSITNRWYVCQHHIIYHHHLYS